MADETRKRIVHHLRYGNFSPQVRRDVTALLGEASRLTEDRDSWRRTCERLTAERDRLREELGKARAALPYE